MRPLKSSARITDKSIFFAQGGGWVVDDLLEDHMIFKGEG